MTDPRLPHETHLADLVGTLRPDICADCRAQDAGAATPDVEAAQAALNRAVSAWANRRDAREGSRIDIDLFQAHYHFQVACQRAFNNATQAAPEYVVPEMPMARELRIANLLAVVNYPHPIPGGDLVRKEAVRRALALLDLDQVPST